MFISELPSLTPSNGAIMSPYEHCTAERHSLNLSLGTTLNSNIKMCLLPTLQTAYDNHNDKLSLIVSSATFRQYMRNTETVIRRWKYKDKMATICTPAVSVLLNYESIHEDIHEDIHESNRYCD